MGFKQKFFNFFRGIYGNDQLNAALLVLYFVVVVVNSFTGFFVLVPIELALVIYMFFRMFSKNIYKRRAENEKFMAFFRKIKNFFLQLFNSIRFRKNFIYKTCPKCHARLRMTRKHGKHTVKCPVCKNEFEIRIL